jgi:hypothetical protein
LGLVDIDSDCKSCKYSAQMQMERRPEVGKSESQERPKHERLIRKQGDSFGLADSRTS